MEFGEEASSTIHNDTFLIFDGEDIPKERMRPSLEFGSGVTESVLSKLCDDRERNCSVKISNQKMTLKTDSGDAVGFRDSDSKTKMLRQKQRNLELMNRDIDADWSWMESGMDSDIFRETALSMQKRE